ncbi:MAG: FMN-binding glutamate synthase family protein, partial [Proteobacteria bacterium]|nr:FMN-binding glutamate synthase family protein [Pseudomonadota bacterium]
MTVIDGLAALFVFLLGFGLASLVVIYIIDVTQTKQAVRRNYPVIGRLRYVFEDLGEFFRQYFFAMDREEMPFNRAERSWVYRAAKGVDSTVAFGSTRDLRPVGTVIFVNCPYPTLDEDAVQPREVTIGADCEHPYKTNSV